MARYSEHHTEPIYRVAEAWKNQCLLAGKSLLWQDESVWSIQTLEAFKRCFTDNPDESRASFEQKLKKQLANDGPEVTKLACDLVLVYYLFTSSVSGSRKRGFLTTIASWKDLEIGGAGTEVLAHLGAGIGGTGLAYNVHVFSEIAYIAEVSLALAAKPAEERAQLLGDHAALRELLDGMEGDRKRQSRDIILHLLFPDRYERIASRSHKNLISGTFTEVLDPNDVPEDLDDRLFAIREKLEQLLSKREFDFYWSPLCECWYVPSEDQDLEPLQGLAIKRQIVFYGPPGTGKTHEARKLADRLVRQGVLRAWGPGRYFEDAEGVKALAEERVRRVQFHPGYSYEDLVRGLQLVDGGNTEYRDGVLLRIIGAINNDPAELRDVPFVLIMDEMNRADLSKVLGECFSLLEDRDVAVQLAGQDNVPREVCIPPNLFFIGTMNLIDQSLEQVDFALRRRFLWFLRGFDRQQFLEVSKYRWGGLPEEKRLRKKWEHVEAEFETLADRADAINNRISAHPSLGSQYQIGHTYFCDVVYFIEKDLDAQPGRQRVIFSRRDTGRPETAGALWKYSLRPLLEQYLSGVDSTEQEDFLGLIKGLLMRGSEE